MRDPWRVPTIREMMREEARRQAWEDWDRQAQLQAMRDAPPLPPWPLPELAMPPKDYTPQVMPPWVPQPPSPPLGIELLQPPTTTPQAPQLPDWPIPDF